MLLALLLAAGAAFAKVAFDAGPASATGAGPLAIAVGDVDGDGKADLVVANADSNTVSVLLGNGDGSFKPQTLYAAGSYPQSLALGDFDNDGNADIVVANRVSGTISLLSGNGDGTFQPQRAFAAGYSPASVTLGDFAGSGKLGLAVVNGADGGISVLLGDGHGGFSERRPYVLGAGASPLAIVSADMDRDGKLDLVVAGSGGRSVALLRGNGDGTFQNPVTVATGSSPFALAAADFNGDGIADLVLADRSRHTIEILLGNGDGTLRPALSFAAGLDPNALAVADFNADGRPDVVVVGAASGAGERSSISVLLGNGDGTLEPPQAVPIGQGNRFVAVAVGNFHGASPDLAIADGSQGSVLTLMNLLSNDCIFADGFQTVVVPGVCPPSITSANSATFKVGTFGSFTVTTKGSTPSLAVGGTPLPGNLSFVDQGDGTGILSGTPTAGKGGQYAITFTATNSAGSTPAQNFTLTVNEAPTITSADNTSFVSTGNNTFNVTTSGWPTGASMAITRTGTLPGGITFTNNNNGTATLSGTPDASAYLSSPYSLTLKADNGIAPFASQTFTLTVLPPPPVAINDPSYTATGGFSIGISAGEGVAVNDTLYGGAVTSYGATTGTEQPVGGYAATAQGGLVGMLGDGTFLYQAPASATVASDTFKYTVANAGGSSTATVTITLLDRVIFVDNTAPGGDGRFGSPYNSLAAIPAAGARAPAGKKALIYVYYGSGGYGANVTLGSGDALFGQGVDLIAALAAEGITLAPNTLTSGFPAATSTPIVSNSVGNTVTLIGNNLVGGLNLGADGGGTTVGGSPSGTSTIGGVSLFCASVGNCVNITGGAGTVQFVSTPLTQFGGGVVAVSGKTGGSVTFDAASTLSGSSGTADAIVLSGNSGATISFAGTLSLATSGASARGFVATGGGTITTTAAGSVISTTSSSAIQMQNVTIGASGVTFQSVSANGAGTGILLNNTGTGAFTISGSGSTSGSGGTVQSCTAKGADIRSAANVTLKNMNFAGNGTANLAAASVCGDIVSGSNNGPANCNANISLSSSSNITLNNVSATGSKQIGIDGNALSNLTLTSVTATGNGDEVGEDGVQLFNTSGTLTVTGGTFKDNAATQFEVGASSGALTANVTGATFSLTNFPTASSPNPPSPGNATANSGLYFHANSGGTATISPTVKGSAFANIYSYALRWDAANGTSTGTINFGQAGGGNGNTFTNDGLGIGVSSTGNGAVTYNIVNNTFTNNTAVTSTFNTTAVSVSFGGTGGTRTGVIDSNIIGTNSAGATASGCFVSGCDAIQVTDSAAINTTHNVTIVNNQAYHVKGAAVRVTSSGSSVDTMRVKIANNLANYPDDATSVTTAILVQDGNPNTAGIGATYSCVDINNNTISGLWAAASSHKSAIRVLASHALQFSLTNFNTGTEYSPGTVTAGCTSQCTGTVGTNGNAADFLSQQNSATITTQIGVAGSSASQNVAVGSAAWTGTSGTCP
ncbi:MAG TPA: FG-GAP-like repeat-containing protein [Rhodanobacteraceae bacterium]|nr:FG-GAP-like repeat-containing protein [Rhodanobacteraceae bacterium]